MHTSYTFLRSGYPNVDLTKSERKSEYKSLSDFKMPTFKSKNKSNNNKTTNHTDSDTDKTKNFNSSGHHLEAKRSVGKYKDLNCDESVINNRVEAETSNISESSYQNNNNTNNNQLSCASSTTRNCNSNNYARNVLWVVLIFYLLVFVVLFGLLALDTRIRTHLIQQPYEWPLWLITSFAAIYYLCVLHFPVTRSRKFVYGLTTFVYACLLSIVIALFSIKYYYYSSVFVTGLQILLIFLLILYTCQSRVTFTNMKTVPYIYTSVSLLLILCIYLIARRPTNIPWTYLIFQIGLVTLLMNYYIILDLQYILIHKNFESDSQIPIKLPTNIAYCESNYQLLNECDDTDDTDYIYKAINIVTTDIFKISLLILTYIFRFVRY